MFHKKNSLTDCILIVNMMKNSGAHGKDASRIKYSAINPEHGKIKGSGISEKSPLLENMESLSISSPVKKTEPEVRKEKADVHLSDNDNRIKNADDNGDKKDNEKVGSQNERVDADLKNSDDSGVDSQGARPKCKQSMSTAATSGGSEEARADGSIDIVRKMSEPRSLNFMPWRIIGSFQTLKQKKCQRLYAATGRHDDLALFYHNGVFYVMEAWCTHMGKSCFYI